MTGNREPPNHPVRPFYGRRKGHRLRPHRRALLDSYLPRIGINLPAAGSCLDPVALFEHGPHDIWLEIGFGSGEHLAHQAGLHAGIGFIGCEPYVNGTASLLQKVDDAGLTNIRVYPDDGRDLLDVLPDASVGRLFLLFPDPWPKVRHHKRRLVNDASLDCFARILKDSAELWFATDHDEYCRWTLAHFLRHPDFDWLAESAGDWRRRAETPPTRYETKSAGEGRSSVYLRIRRRKRLSKTAASTVNGCRKTP